MESKRKGVFSVSLLISLLAFVNCAEDCLPDVGRSGTKSSTVLIVQTWVTRTSNFQTSSPTLESSDRFTVQKSSKVSRVGGANVRFYGDDLCVAVTKAIESEKSDGSVDRRTTCQKSCLRAGGRTRLDTYSGSGGKITSSNPPCCFWARKTELRLSIPAPPTTPPPSYQCISCTGCGDAGVEMRTESCSAGDKCFTLKLQRKQNGEVVIVKGCSSTLRYWGKNLDCDYKCKNNVKLDEYTTEYSVCAACCTGNKCNLKATSGANSIRSYISVALLVTAVMVYVQ